MTEGKTPDHMPGLYSLHDAFEDAFDLIEGFIENGPNQFGSVEEMKTHYAAMILVQHIMPMDAEMARLMVDKYFQDHADFVFREGGNVGEA